MGKPWWLVAFIIVGLLLGVGVLLLVTQPPRGEPVQLLPLPTSAPITVFVSGGVNHSGLYTLPVGSRINDAILAAGGFSTNADSAVLNLAEVLDDGEKINVPYLQAPSATENITRAGNQASIQVDINSATLEQLDTLPQIGPKTAQNIIDYRNANGPFTRIEDILEVPGIGPITYDKIKDLITVGTSP